MRTMRVLVLTVVAAQSVAVSSLYAQGRGSGKHHDDTQPVVVQVDARTEPRAEIHVVFSTRDTAVIREYYAPHYRNLPPGLQKKYARTGRLPPGWQKKMQPMPVVVERRLAPLPAGYQRGVFEGRAVIYRPGGVIVDATVLF